MGFGAGVVGEVGTGENGGVLFEAVTAGLMVVLGGLVFRAGVRAAGLSSGAEGGDADVSMAEEGWIAEYEDWGAGHYLKVEGGVVIGNEVDLYPRKKAGAHLVCPGASCPCQPRRVKTRETQVYIHRRHGKR